MSKSLLWIIILVIIIGGAVYILNKRSTPQTSSTQTTSQASPTGAPSVSPSETGKVAQGQTVTFTTNGFEPATVTIKAGETVTWTNKSGAVVRINSAVHPTHLVYPPLNLGNIEDGASVSLTFDKPGSYKYHNHLDPSQTGTVVVQ